MRKIHSFIFALMLGVSNFAVANEFEPQVIDYMNEKVSSWVRSAEIIDATKLQNIQNNVITDAEIEALDTKWREEAEAGSGPLIDNILKNDLSRFLTDIKNQSDEAITEIFVFDKKGLNVGQSDVTSDYFQGDEAKWQKSVGTVGAEYYLSDVEFDESTQTYQANLTVTLFDNAEAIGAVTIGLNVENIL